MKFKKDELTQKEKMEIKKHMDNGNAMFILEMANVFSRSGENRKAQECINQIIGKINNPQDSIGKQIRADLKNSKYDALHISFSNSGKVSIIPDEGVHKGLIVKRKKKVFACFALVAVVSVAAIAYSCFIMEHELEAISLSSDDSEFDVAKEYEISANLSPSNASDKNIVWTVDSSKVIYVADGSKFYF